jgi:simple sugar transport system ATP-binding protein
MVGITKEFPGTLANDNVTLDVRAGEVHGLLGENGAGKTTLMNILYGLLRRDQGEIFVNGQKVSLASPRDANAVGIGMVHQHFMLVENLTVLENVLLGMPQARPPLLDLNSARARFLHLCDEYGLSLDPSTPVWELPVGVKQWVEILKLLFRDVRLLVLDEPTAVLAPSEVEDLFRTVRRLVQEGRSVIFITHKLGELLEIADRITVLRDGRVVGCVDANKATAPMLANMMVGRDVVLARRPRQPRDDGKATLVIRDLCCDSDRGVRAVRDLDLTVYAGEIVGVAGVDGNGQGELAQVIAGLRKPTSGSVEVGGKVVSGVVSDQALLGYIPEDRRKTGIVGSFSVEDNMVIKNAGEPPFSRHGFLNGRAIREHAIELIRRFNIKTSHPSEQASHLSGGNQQRVVVARELAGQPRLIAASQPTRGLDVAAVDGVHEVLLQERNRGAAVLFISTELPEVLSLSDRIVVMFKGQIMGEVSGEDPNVNVIGQLMLGHRLEEATAI